MPTPHVPATLDEITPEWLTSALASRGHLDGARAVDVELELLSEGVGFVGFVGRLRIAYDRPDAGPSSVIAKLPRPDPVLRERTRPLRLYEREIGFYEELAPRTPIKLPRCWYTGMDVPADRFILLLEDLSPARTGDQVAGCTLAEARLIVGELARLHAAWWCHPALAGLDWLFPVNDPRQLSLQERYREAWPLFCDRWAPRIPPEALRVGEAYGRHFGWLLDRIAEMPNTVQHADVRLDNILFGSGPDGEWVSIIDWQAPTRGGGMQDLGYFVSQSLPVDLRRAHERELLDLYLATLRGGGVRDYGSEQAIREYRAGVLWGLLVPVWGAGNVDLSVPRAAALFDAMVDRSVTAILDWKAGDVLPP